MNRFSLSGNVVYGEGSIQFLKEIILNDTVKKTLLITDKGLMNHGVVNPILDILIESGINYFVYDGVVPNPTDKIVNECYELFKDEAIEMIVAIGGGSVMDAAKAINILLSNGGRIEDYFTPGNINKATLPLVAIPTTAGTASEVTEVSVITDTQNKRKVVIPDRKLAADYAILDCALTFGLPAHITAATGMDALTHAIEAYVSTLATPFTDTNAKTAMDIIVANIEHAVKDGQNKSARENMMIGSTMAGFAFNSAILGLVHAIAHPLGAHYDIPHGVANAIMLPYVMGYNASACGEKLLDIGQAIGLTRDECTGDRVEERLMVLNQSIGIPSLKSTGIKEDEFEFLASEVMKEPSIAMNPRLVKEEEVVALLKRAYQA
jgi:alcohol dehydrogenase